MKKLMAIMMSLLVLALTGCKADHGDVPPDPETTEPLRVFIDVEFGSRVFVSAREFLDRYEETRLKNGEKEYTSFEKVIAELGGPEDVEIEIPSRHGQEREVYLTALRTEMMAGKGPDVFVTLSGCGWHPLEDGTGDCYEESMFKFPQQAMERNMFLPLDDYIEDAQFMEWDKLTPAVMEAGRNGQGQLLLPMTYTLPMGVFRSGNVDFTLEGNTGLSWGDMLEGPGELQQTAAYIFETFNSAALAPLADYKNDKLAISEEELLWYVSSRQEARKRFEGQERPWITRLYSDMETETSDELTFVPTFSRSGGYRAVITSFSAINANTRRPEDAFFVVDYFMGREAQQSKLYCHMLTNSAVPTLEGLLSGRGYGVYDVVTEKYVAMPDNVYREFEELRDGLSGADFYTVLERELNRLFFSLEEQPDKPVEKLVHDAYMRMNMVLAES